MKAYKGFDKDLKCRGFQYEIGKEYKQDGEISACSNGFHACEAPLDVFKYYQPASSRYCEVEQSGSLDRDSDDSKIASSDIRIGAEIGVAGLVKAHFEYVKSHTTTEHTDQKMATAGDYGAATAGYRGAATAGYRGAATAGDGGAATAGYGGAATAGNCGAATAGNYGAATAGNCGAAIAGYRGAAIAGDRGAAIAGDGGAATAGRCGAATSRGATSVDENGCALVRGDNVRIRGGIGAILVIAVENDRGYDIKDWKAVVVDGEQIKADTWYTLQDGELVEVGDGNECD